jgi:hypothetical protein
VAVVVVLVLASLSLGTYGRDCDVKGGCEVKEWRNTPYGV